MQHRAEHLARQVAIRRRSRSASAARRCRAVLPRQRHLVHGMARRAHRLDMAVEALLRARPRSPGRHRSTSRSGLPRPSSAIAPLSMGRTRSAMSSCRQSTRSAEQRWPAESKAEVSASSTSCSGRAEESAIMAFCPPVSAISTGGRPSASSVRASCRWIEPRHLGRAGEHHAGHRRIADQRGADLAVAGQELQRRARHAGLVQQRARRSAAISGVSSAGLAITRVAGRERAPRPGR